MKKFSALFIVALFLISMVPMIAAEDTTADTQTVSVDTSVVTSEDSDVVVDNEVDSSEPQPTLISANSKAINKDEVRQKILDTRADFRAKIADIREGAAIKFENLREEQAKNMEKLDDLEMKKMALLDRARMKKISALDEAQMKLELAKLRIVEVKKDLLFKKRVISEAMKNKAKESYDKAEKQYNESKDEFEKEKAKFEEFKGKDEAKALEHAKKFLNHAGDVVIHLLEKVKSKVQENDGLTDNESSTIIADIDARIVAVKAAQDKVNASTTKDEVKEAGKAIIDEWGKIKSDVKEYVGRLVNAQVGEIIQRSEQLEKKLNDVLTEMKNNSINVDSLNTKVDLFSMRVEEARNKFKTAQSLFEQVKTMKGESMTADRLNTIRTLSEQAKNLAKEAHSALQEAHSILMTIVRDVKQAGGEDINLESEASNATTVEVVQDVTAAETEDVETTEAVEESQESTTEDSTETDTTEQETDETQDTVEVEDQEEETQATETNSTEVINETATA